MHGPWRPFPSAGASSSREWIFVQLVETLRDFSSQHLSSLSSFITPSLLPSTLPSLPALCITLSDPMYSPAARGDRNWYLQFLFPWRHFSARAKTNAWD